MSEKFPCACRILLSVEGHRKDRNAQGVAGADKELGAKFFNIVGPRIAKRREELGLSQEELADLAGLHRTAISPLELGKHGTRVVTVYRIATALGVAPIELLDGVYLDLESEEFTDQPPFDDVS
ncbi:MAG: helix-turn-helix transcriptional regulator [Actinobacteria bacterium]|nr:helix-turn-helix transcriptional regulator [Actinomycetota bacterium]